MKAALSITLYSTLAIAAIASATEREEIEFDHSIAPLVKQFCHDCHNADESEGDFRVDGIQALQDEPADVQRWEKILEMVSIGDMPPEDADQPNKQQRKQLVDWIDAQLQRCGRGRSAWERGLPKFGNRIDHDELFSGRHKGPAYTDARVWRMNAHIYSQLVMDLELGRDFVPPLDAAQGEGFDDYALLYADEAAIRTMLSNAKRVALTMVEGRLVKPRGAGARKPGAKAYRTGSRHQPLSELAATEEPTPRQLEEAVRYTFQVLLHREPTEEELGRYVTKNLAPNIDAGGPSAGVQALLVSVLLSPEFLFRMEMGLGKQRQDGRRMLSPHELAYALSYTLHDHPVKSLLAAADEGRLNTREDVEREARRLLDDPQLLRGRMAVGSVDRVWAASKPYDIPAKPRLLRFFQEYFDYAKAPSVFKDDIRHGGSHDARRIVKDANWLVLSILAEDQDVLRKLLTTDRYMVDYYMAKRETATHLGYAVVYNLPEPAWPVKNKVQMPAGQRAGMLTHPAWLVAHSGNFETDPVRRGKWIQEHLLGGVVPDLPINVQAQLPEEPHDTMRQRFRVVKEEKCWRCHKKMNPLGDPLEAYDDFGRFRDMHHVDADGNVLASVLQMGHRRQYAEGEAEPKIPVDTSGVLQGTGNPRLDGPVKDAVDLMHRLAESERVRQVFIRHVFRYWMGRNETLKDSPTLIAMDRAYVESGGSFKETLVALFTSDSFLYRK